MTKPYSPKPIISVFIEQHNGVIEPIGLELISKAGELAASNNMKTLAFLLENEGNYIDLSLLENLVNHIDIYRYKKNLKLNILDYRDCLKKHIYDNQPRIVLIGATLLGRSFAPRVAAYFKTGITADCTELRYDNENGLIQIRPAYSGDVIARIITSNHYPQIATVRPGVMKISEIKNDITATRTIHKVDSNNEEIRILERKTVDKETTKLEDAEVVVLAGNAIKYDEELEIIKKLAKFLKGEWAVTRPLVEGGLVSYTRQVGISGKILRPKLVLAFGVSGTTQTLAGISKAEKIVAINKDKNAPIFKNSDIGIIDDWRIIAESIIEKLNK